METIYRCVAGLDVHKEFVTVAVRSLDEQGKVATEVETFGTMTSDLLALSDWMAQRGVTHVAMESTGVLWKPVWNILEGRFECLLVNARELKQVPGRKSDIRDCQWIAQLLACGLLRSSFVPEAGQRALRDLTRLRAALSEEQGRVANRIHKVLQDANIKLSSVATDILGKSGRRMLAAIIAGERNPERLAELALGRLRKKEERLRLALQGHVSDHHVFLLRELLDHLDYLDGKVARLDEQIEQAVCPFVSEATMQRLTAVPGLQRRTIENVVAEIGSDMKQFPTSAHLSSWAGVCPGNEESAGKRKRSKTTKGSRWLRRALAEAAWGASRTKGSYFKAQYHRLAPRRGRKRAIVAISHSLLEVIYYLLRSPDTEYHDLGEDHFAKQQPERLRRYLVKRLQSLGYDVTLTERPDAA